MASEEVPRQSCQSEPTVYEWNGYFGEVGPVTPESIMELFDRRPHGAHFKLIDEIEVVQEGPTKIRPIVEFEHAGLHPAMISNIELANYKRPTPIQRFAIPAINLGHDVIAVGQNGTGKTAAYLIPILGNLMGKAKELGAPRPDPATFRRGIDPSVRAEPLVAIVCPSVELARQTFNAAKMFCHRTLLRPCVIGTGPLAESRLELEMGCDVLVSTPGRLAEILGRPFLTFKRLRYMVIDEADEVLNLVCNEQLKKIMGTYDKEAGVQWMIFAATLPKHALELARKNLSENHVQIRVGRAGSTHKNIEQDIISCPESGKLQLLRDVMSHIRPMRTMIFVNRMVTADAVLGLMLSMNIPSRRVDAESSPQEVADAIEWFSSDRRVLVATGMASRGIDVPNILHVINYDLPWFDDGGIDGYIHRIGRTGRMGYQGRATSFYSEENEQLAPVLTRTLLETNQKIPDFLWPYIPDLDARKKLDFEEFSPSGYCPWCRIQRVRWLETWARRHQCPLCFEGCC